MDTGSADMEACLYLLLTFILQLGGGGDLIHIWNSYLHNTDLATVFASLSPESLYYAFLAHFCVNTAIALLYEMR